MIQDLESKDNKIFYIKRPHKIVNRPQIIANLELVGAMFILHGNYKHGLEFASLKQKKSKKEVSK
jgi:hypothetical protein